MKPHNQRGFSFLELAIGMALMGILLGGGLLVMGKRWEGDQREQTYKLLLNAKKSILNYARVKGRLPISDVTGDGRAENPDVDFFTGTVLNVGVDGVVDRLRESNNPNQYQYRYFYGLPYRDLEVSGYDSYGSRIIYKANYNLNDPKRENNCNTIANIYRNVIKVRTDEASYMTYTAGTSNWMAYPLVFDETRREFAAAAILGSPGERDFDTDVSNDKGTDAYEKFDTDPDDPSGFRDNEAAYAWMYSTSVKSYVKKNKQKNFDDMLMLISYAEAYEALGCGAMTFVY